jgi:GT2 family glycosyltransferase
MRFFPSNNLAVSKKRFHELGGFDTSFLLAGGEDREFCYRWLQSGGRLRRAPNAVVEHAHRLNPASATRVA